MPDLDIQEQASLDALIDAIDPRRDPDARLASIRAAAEADPAFALGVAAATLSGFVGALAEEGEAIDEQLAAIRGFVIESEIVSPRPATLDDMRRFWPDKTDEELQAAAAAIAAAGGEMTVVREATDG